MTAQRPFRFGVNMVVPGSRAAWIEKCRRAEELGYDVVGVADHLGLPAPFPALILAAEATQRVRLNTFVLNVPFYNATLLAREIATVDQFTEGRIELGLGAGYAKDEFDAAGLPFESGGKRVDRVEHTVRTLRRLYADPEYQPRPAQQHGPPLLIAGWGDRMLRLAAEHAAVIAFTGAASPRKGGPLLAAGLAETENRVAFARRCLGDRADQVEFNLLIQAIAKPQERAELLATYGPLLPPDVADTPEELPILLLGSHEEMAAHLRARRERYGFSYVTVLEDNMDKLAPVMALLR
ncbi:LLM class F420-dependent oxidoreductase [Nocardia callitridis]|uniref:TIGR03621 family F420-dependent LLM class oxidoreductase n=1 Tax=Nocardia callitridis TaxID=648753 RepID=A0ABP9K6D9_9NOCA